jgi:tetratricopeptide (TPR) repeat protein
VTQPLVWLLAVTAILVVIAVQLGLAARLRLAGAARLYKHGRYESALDRIRPLLAHRRYGARAHYAAGACHVRLGRLGEAVDHFRTAVDGGLADAEGALGAALLGTGRPDEATPHLKAVARRGDPDAHVLLATIAEERGDTQGALLDLLVATSLDPDDPDAFAALGALYARLNRHDRAEAALTRAVAIEPTHREALMVLAERRARCGDRNGAREAARALLTYHGADPDVRRSLTVLGLLPPGAGRPARD